jgi:hypothetical protein
VKAPDIVPMRVVNVFIFTASGACLSIINKRKSKSIDRQLFINYMLSSVIVCPYEENSIAFYIYEFNRNNVQIAIR